MKHLVFALAILGAAPTVAFAQGEPPPDSGQTTTPTVPPAGGAPGEMGAGPSIFQHGTMGLSFGLVTAGPAQDIDLTYFLDNATALDLILGLNYAHTPTVTMGMPPVTTGGDLFGFTVGLGYRMYKHHSQKVHLYIEPDIVLSATDASNNFGNTFEISVGVAAGVEAMFTDWFSISGQIGADLDFTNKFKTIDFATFRTGLFANFYWI